MSLILNSPGVQINETDLSNYSAIQAGTNIFVAGFAPQGPTDEVIQITSVTELQSVFGTPTNAAERYFYYSCQGVLNSRGNLLTTRLPYGLSSGYGFSSNSYSALFYPVLSSEDGFTFGAPSHITLNENDVTNIKTNNFSWSPVVSTSETADWDMESSEAMDTGIIVLNASQTAVDEHGQGYYVSLTDNSGFGPNKAYNSITTIQKLTETDTFAEISLDSLSFSLSASVDSVRSATVSQIDEHAVDFLNFASMDYQDCLILNVWKARNSLNDATRLSINNVESYVGSLNSSRTQANPRGGANITLSLANIVNSQSNNIFIAIHPDIASNPNWSTQMYRASSTGYGLYTDSIYTPSYEANKSNYIGNVVQKLERALTLIDNPDTVTVDLVVDAGLSTIFANSADNADINQSEEYDDTMFINTTDLSDPTDARNEGWVTIFDLFNTFCKETRKDCMFIADPLRQIFVNGANTKTTAVKSSTFTTSIYNPLVASVGVVDSNYAAVYGNWAKKYDSYSNTYQWLPISGLVAGTYANSDAATQTWFAPAGLNRGQLEGIVELAFNPNQKQRDYLYLMNVNPVCFFPHSGFTVWGQKTLQAKPSAFDRVNVRRLFLTLERATQKATKYYVFEPNTNFTRKRLVNTITPIFDLAKNTQGVYDYLIVCDTRNNTPAVIDQNELVVDIYIKPVKAAEFILVNFIATTTGQNFKELVA